MRTLIINFKNYKEILGDGSMRLAEAALRAGSKTSVRVIVAPPAPFIRSVASKVSIPVFAQSVGSDVGEKATGAILPEAVRAAGGAGTILNHSESRRSPREIKTLLPRLHSLSMEVCLCARTSSESAALSKLDPEYLAVEPPGLIGTGIAVSRARPGLISRTVSAARKAGYQGRVLCGAGIVSGEDVSRAVQLGADGVLVSSSVVKAPDWDEKVEELARPLM